MGCIIIKIVHRIGNFAETTQTLEFTVLINDGGVYLSVGL